MTADEATLARLMAQSQDGDRQAYRQLLELVDSLLRRTFRRRIAEHSLDDLVQETLMSLHHKRATWDLGRPFLPWLMAIARYRWVDQLRRGYAVATSTLLEPDLPDGSEAALAPFGCERLLQMLPPGQADAIRCTRIEGLSTQQAAERLGQSESLVKVNVHRGMRKLSLLVEELDS
ncbi:MAG: sigma-70 family RNA polymerase sigma factor [Sandaracinobacteroides sp.]